MRLCPECGVVLPVDVRFCLQCGTPVVQESTTPPPALEPIPVELPVMAAPAVPLLPPEQEAEPAPSPVFSPAAPPIAAEVTPAEPSPAQIEPQPEGNPELDDQDFLIRRPVYTPNSTLSLKGSPSPMIAPRDDVPLARHRVNPGRNMVEFDEESLNVPSTKRRSEDKPLCRFCRGPLDLDGDFCEQCGAPVADALPPGTARNRKPAD